MPDIDMSGWRYMDTAPKGGTAVLLWDDDVGHWEIGRWSDWHDCWHQLQWGTDEPPHDENMTEWTIFDPIRWMPLPGRPHD